jgi:hypothetical protein
MLFRTIRCFYMRNFSFMIICYNSQWSQTAGHRVIGPNRPLLIKVGTLK